MTWQRKALRVLLWVTLTTLATAWIIWLGVELR